jgi:hypothetical protein
MAFGVLIKTWEAGRGANKSGGRIGSVVVWVGSGRKFEARLATVNWFGGKKCAPRRQEVRGTKWASVEL